MAIENVPFPVPPVFAMLGSAVNVNAPELVPDALLTVIVPVLAPVPPEFNAGEGADIVRVAPVTVKFSLVVDVPSGPVTLIMCTPRNALGLIVKDAVREVPAPFMVGVPNVMPPPVLVEVTAVTEPSILPPRVTLRVVPRTPLDGLIDVRCGRPTPVPLIATGAPLTGTLALMVKEALKVTALFGVNVMVMVQLLPGARLPVHVFVSENGADRLEILMPVALAPPVLVKVSV